MNYLKQDPKINLKLGLVIVACFVLSSIVPRDYANGFWISSLLNSIAFATFGLAGVVAIVRNETFPFMRVPFLPPRVSGAIIAVIGFGMALATLGLLVLILSDAPA